ncbi:MBL fold metallo-hydrolase [Chloroflexota bacterium]
MTLMVKDDTVGIERLTLGPWGTNAYIVVCQRTQESVVVDAPAEANKLVASLHGTEPKYILLTHNHGDHIGALEELRGKLQVPLAAHPLDAGFLSSPPEIELNDGDKLAMGNLEMEVMHTPGHTLGSLCFRLGNYLLAGDTIFPGGPGRTRSPAAFQQIVKSITEKIFLLSDDTRVYSGHGEATVLEKEKEEFVTFSSRKHDPNLCGDVLWISS